MIVMVTQNAALLSDAGFDPTARIEALQGKLQTADDAEGEQQKTQAAALDATKLAN